MISLVLENCESFDIPKKYIIKKKVRKSKLKTLWVDKKYLSEIDKYIGLSWEGRSIDDMQFRFKTALDITQILYKDKTYFVSYIEQDFYRMGSENILQKVEVTSDVIKFTWDIDKRNIRKGGYDKPSILYIHERYKNLNLSGYDKIIYWK